MGFTKSNRSTYTKRKLQKSKSVKKHLQRTQDVFNKWIRMRDADKGCICFGCNGPVEHASHYFAAGSYSKLRFNEMNVHGSCMRCNTFLHGNLINYRKGLVLRYGEDKVKQLELLAEVKSPHKWKDWDLQILREKYANQF